MRVPSVLLALSLLATILSGCSSKASSASPSSSPDSEVVVGEGVDPDAGEVSGLVVDDSTQPIMGATVGLLPLNVQATTDEGGEFVFSNVPPGEYQLVAAKLGYSSAARKVTLEPQGAIRQTLTIAAVAIEEVRHEVFGPYTGYLVCGFVRPGVQGTVGTVTYDCANTFSAASNVMGEWKNSFKFKMTQENLAGVVGETQWTPSAAGTSPKLQTFFSHDRGSSSHWWCSAMGTSPTRFVYTLDQESERRACHDKGSSSADPEPTSELNLETSVYLPFCRVSTSNPSDVPVCVTYQQRYTAMATIFYGEGPDAEYTAFPDA